MPRLLLQLRKILRRHRCNSGRVTASMTAPKTLLGHTVASQRNVGMASARRYSIGSFITSKGPPRMSRLQKSTRLWLTEVANNANLVQMRMDLRSCSQWFLRK